MKTKLRYIAVLFAVALTLASCVPAVGQVLKGSISGTAVDPQGAVVAGAQVQAKNVDTGVVQSTTSDSSGLFRLNLLPAGTYTIEISAKGFKSTVAKNWVVSAGVDTGMGSVKLSVGEASTTVEVTAAAPLIETTQAQVTSTFTGTTLTGFAGIQENEGLDRLALFVPGVVATRSDNFSNTNGVGFSSNGLRGRNNDQEIDGQNNNDNSVGGPGLFLSDTEFVAQYVIVTNNFGPEYGRNAGSVVNIITKGGTNAWHGSVFGEENSSFLNALNNTQHQTNVPGSAPCPPGQLICHPFSGPPRSNNEFSGGTIGGPIVKNKAFIFGGFDDQIISANTVDTTTSLTPTPDGLAQAAACPLVNPAALALLQKFGAYSVSAGNPVPRNPTTLTLKNTAGTIQCPISVGGVTRIVPTPAHGFDWVTRSDVQLGKDTLYGRYLFNRNNNFNGNDNGAAGWFDDVLALSQSALISETHNFSARMVNEARISFSRLGVEFGGGLNPLEPQAGQLKNAFTNITITGALGMGPATNLPQSRLVNTWQAQDNWNYVLGRHSIKSGVNWTYQRSPNIFLPLINGGYRFSSLTSFLTTFQPNRVQIAQGASDLDFREYDTFLYAGDDWKIGSNLTLNLGVTWTYYGQPANLFNQITTKRESNPATALWLQSLPLSVRTDPQIPSVKNSFGPSVGFAYQPQWGGFLTGHGQTTIRGGYRLLYDPPFYNIFVNISSSSPETFLQTLPTVGLPSPQSNPPPAVPTGPNVRAALAGIIAPNFFDPRTQNETSVSPNFGPDKVHSWSLGVERQVTKNSAVEARYVGNHAVDLFQTVDANPYAGTATKPGLLQTFPQLIPNASAITPCATTAQSGPGAGTDVGRVNCGLGVARQRNNGGFSDYQGMQLEFRANNLAKQLTARIGYTWSKNLDNVSEIFATGTAGNTAFAAQNPFQTGSAERSISGLNIPNAFTVLAIEQLPFFKSEHGLLGTLLGGWTVSADYILASGQPYTPIQGLFEAVNTAPANYYDSSFVGAFLGADAAHPFSGNLSAPVNAVGIYASDFCRGVFGITPTGTPTPTTPGACNTNLTSPTQLISYNAMNGNGSIASSGAALPGIAGTPVTKDQVRFIINGAVAQSVFGTPFGNVPRNALTDAKSNIVNLSIYKHFRLGEHASFEMHATALNAFNHFNFNSIDPNLEDASVSRFGSDFANPAITTAGGRTLFVGGKVSF